MPPNSGQPYKGRGTPSPSPSSYHQASPLTTLVRKASSRRAQQEQVNLLYPTTPPRKGHQEWSAPNSPVSPLLHTQFRSSTATSSSYNEENSYIVDGDRSTISWGDSAVGGSGEADRSRPTSRESAYSAQTARIQSMASVYSDVDDIIGDYQDRQSWQPSSHPPEGATSGFPAGRHPIQAQSRTTPHTQAYALPPSAIPSVVVSPGEEPDPTTPITARMSYNSGRVPSQIPSGHRVANFSRPVPPVIDGTEQRKREVLMRNAGTPSPFARSFKHESASPSIVPSIRVEDVETDTSGSRSAPSHQTAFREDLQPSGMPRAGSPSSNSLYSSYSYYPYDGNTDTPPSSSTQLAQTQTSSSLHPSGRASPSSNTKPPKGEYDLSAPDALTNPRTPQDYLQLGITHHIANRLEDSAQCFEKSATVDRGCGVGMLMWGLALRHGWGVPPNEEKGFKWLRKAAEGAVTGLESAKAGMDTSAIKSELVIAIYEVGQSFFRGWGVEKDKKMGVNYFRVAARLGDADAQQNLAFALEHGKGCKKDRKEAALWYRAAVKQGVSDIGLAWIYKEKFQ